MLTPPHSTLVPLSHSRITIQPSKITVQPSISTFRYIILNQSLIPCYSSPRFAGSSLHFMHPRPAVLKTDYPMRIVILSKRLSRAQSRGSEPKDLSSSAARRPAPQPSSLRPVFFQHQSRVTNHEPPFLPRATVDSKRLTGTLSPLESALTSHAQLIEKTATLNPLESTLTRFGAVTPLEATLTKKVGEGGPAAWNATLPNGVTLLALSLFSTAYKLPNSQVICFDNDPTMGGVWGV